MLLKMVLNTIQSTFSLYQSGLIMTLIKKVLENIARNVENDENQHFLLLFSHNVFYCSKDRNHHVTNISFVVCKSLEYPFEKPAFSPFPQFLLPGQGLKSSLQQDVMCHLSGTEIFTSARCNVSSVRDCMGKG